MAVEDELRILERGVKAWNKWREDTSFLAVIDLSGADLSGRHLKGINLSYANLQNVNFKNADLSMSDLANADLSGADLSGADLWLANLLGATFTKSKFLGAEIGYTIFGNSDLSNSIGLESVVHRAPSTIGVNTFSLSKGNIPEIFLRRCGSSDVDIEYAKLSNPELTDTEINQILYKIYDLKAVQSLQISPLFISYSHVDRAFVDRLENYLNKEGVRFWRDIHDMKSGRMERQIDRAIRLNPIVLLILSENSLQSDWVEHEVRTARALEKEMKRDVLCPVTLDDSWKNSPWAKRIMEQIMEYNILDFSEWKDDAKFENTFNKLIDGLELFYK